LGLNSFILSLTFIFLALLRLSDSKDRAMTFSRQRKEWIIDVSGLFIQGVIIPATPFFLVPLLRFILPNVSARYEIHTLFQFIISFVMIDYLYYWNHRIFHSRKLWHIHRLHHSSVHLDIISTSRNSFFSSFLFIYIWFQTMVMFLFHDYSGFILGLLFTYCLDLWRHSGLRTPTIIQPFISWFLLLPEDHLLHHSLQGRNKNFGANFSWWDKIHGTYSNRVIENKNLNPASQLNILKELFYPGRI
jgi:sterol desaturase/sphingolipid hydroxylase (fatty acid hydroxylase superfamily)